MAPPADSFALARAEAILLDGANSVSGQPRAQFPAAVVSSAIALAALVLVLAWLRGRRPGWVLAGVAVAAALPGAWCVLALRGDAPLTRPAMAAKVETALATLEAVAPWPGTPVAIVHEDDDVLFPLGRYAWPARPAVTSAVRVELRGGSLDVQCAPDAVRGAVVCGGAP